MLTLYEYSDEDMNAKACLLAFVIELKKRLENKESLKVNISESIYSQISNAEFKVIDFFSIFCWIFEHWLLTSLASSY